MVTGGHGEEIDSPTNVVEVEHQGACRRRFGGSLTAGGGTEAYRHHGATRGPRPSMSEYVHAYVR